MNLALIAHIMSQRLQRGEIWPSWLALGRMPWAYAPVLVLLMHGPGNATLESWLFHSSDPTIIFGRLVYLAALCLSGFTVLVWPLGELPFRWVATFERDALTPRILVESRPSGILLDIVIPELLTFLLRLCRYLPLFGIAAVAAAIDWRTVFSTWLVLIIACIAQVLFVIATTLVFPNVIAINGVVVGLWACWYLKLSYLSAAFGTGFRLGPDATWPLLILTACAFTVAVVAVRLRLREERVSHRRHTRRAITLGTCASALVALLTQRAMAELKFWGTWRGRFFQMLIAVAVAPVPIVGGILLLTTVIYMTAHMLYILTKEQRWDEIWLSVTDSAQWRYAVVHAFVRVSAPIIPALVAFLFFGRVAFRPAWDVTSMFQSFSDETNSVVASLLLVLLITAGAAWAIVLCAAIVVSTLDGLLLVARNESGVLADANKPFVLVVLALAIHYAQAALIANTMSGMAMYLIALGGTAISAALAALLVAFSYRRIKGLLAGVWDVDLADLEDAVLSMNALTKWHRDRQRRR